MWLRGVGWGGGQKDGYHSKDDVVGGGLKIYGNFGGRVSCEGK